MAPRTATWPWASWRRWHGAAASSYLRWCPGFRTNGRLRSEEHTSELQSQSNLVCRLLLEKNTQLEIDPEALNLVPAQIAKKHAVLPIKRVGNMLTLAMADPTDVFALDNVAFMTNLHILPLVASEVAIREAIERHYEGQTSGITDIVSELNSGASPDVEVVDEGDEAATKIDVFELKESADEAPVVKLVNKVLADAIQKGASDIHWESYEKVFRIRFRIDGVLHEMLSLPKKVEAATISRLKIMSNLDIAERRVPQDGRIKLRYNTREID